ncbi:MAG: TIGR04076 family protein [Candidatus Altiarchaeota archaeon]
MKNCFNCSQPQLNIKVNDVETSCPFGHKKGDKFSTKDMVPVDMCAHAYHVAIPYIHTMMNHGWMRWVRKGDGVIVQCPSHEENMVVKIKKPKDNIVLEVFQVRGKCRFGHVVGQRFEITSDKVKVCPKIFDITYPYSENQEKLDFLYCPKPDGVKLRKASRWPFR